MTEQVCPIPHRSDPLRPRRAAPGLLVCAGCADRIGRTVSELPQLHADLEHVLVGTWRDRAGDDTWPLAIAEMPLPLQPKPLECREAIRHRLVSWSVMVAEERGEHAPGSTLAAVARWLVDRHDWVLAQLWVDDYVAEMSEVFGRARSLLEPSGIRRVPCGPCREHVEGPAGEGGAWPVTCPGTLVAQISKDVDKLDHPTCDSCGEVVTLDHHAALQRGLAGLVDTQAAAVLLGVPASTIRRWQSEGRVKASGVDASNGRALWRVEVLERLKRDDVAGEVERRGVSESTKLRLVKRLTGRVA